MGIIDQLFNSFRKRMFILVLIFAGCYLASVVNNYKVGAMLMNMSDFSNVFEMVDYGPIRQTFIGSLLTNYLDTTNGPLVVVASSFGIYRLLGFILINLIMFSYLPEDYQCLKTLIVLGLLMIIAEYFGVFYFGLRAMTVSYSGAVIGFLHMVGMFFKYFSLVQIVFTLFSVFYIAYKQLTR